MFDTLTKYWKLHKVAILLSALGVLLYAFFAFQLVRTDFPKLLGLFTALFFIYLKLIQFEKWNLRFLVGMGVLFRLLFLFAEPNLSQDYFRFIWDGELAAQGINPYLYTPDTLIAQTDVPIANAQVLYDGMGSLSARNYSNYPPFNQLLFALASLLGGKTIFGSLLVMRTTIILADIGILYFGRKLLLYLNKSPHLIFWYFLNPLVIIELTGNLHFEGVMLFFFVWALFLTAVKKWLPAAVVYAISIGVKLVPLLFLPLVLKYFGLKKSVLFYGSIVLFCFLMVVPFYSPEFITNYSKTVGLWFSNFEFNAGLYNGIKLLAVQFDAKPWELIKTYGKITPILTIAVVLYCTFFRDTKKITVLLNAMLWVLSFYYLTSPTVHPWYLIFLVTLCIFTSFRFPIVWSGLAVLSYFAYANETFSENLWLLGLEYALLFGYMGYEIITVWGKKVFFRKN